jgi:hypothetical protein
MSWVSVRHCDQKYFVGSRQHRRRPDVVLRLWRNRSLGFDTLTPANALSTNARNNAVSPPYVMLMSFP